MASTPAVSMALPLTHKTVSSDAPFIKPLSLKPSALKRLGTSSSKRVSLRASLAKEKAMAAALTASMIIPEVAEAAGPGVSPSLQNFLLSIAAGGVVLFAILGAVVGVSNFDPVKRA